MTSKPGFICPFCGDQTEVVAVRGHSQCSECHQVIETCCEGDSVQRTAESTDQRSACDCGGQCNCSGEGCKKGSRTLVRTGIPAKWHCADCGREVDPLNN